MAQNKLARIMPVFGEQRSEPTLGRDHVTSDTLACNELKALKSRNGKPYSLGHQKMYLTGIEAITGNGPCSVLDVGCGIGFGIGALIARKHEGPIVATEPEGDCIRFVVEKFKDTEADLTIMHSGFLEAIALEPADYVFCIEVIEHIKHSDVGKFLKKLRKLTIKNLFFSTPDSSKSSHGVATDAEWEAALREVGFNVVSISQQWTTLFVCR